MINLDPTSLSYFDVAAFILTVTQDERPVFSVVNECWCQMASLQQEDVTGKTAQEIFGTASGEAFYKRHLDVIRTRERVTYDLPLFVDGAQKTFRTTLSPVLDAAGQVIQLVGVTFDQTAELERAAFQEHMTKVNTDIERFISIAAHDLRTPMQNVRHLTDLLRDDFEDHGDGKIELLDMLEHVAVKASELLADILSHARATNAPQTQEPFEVAQLSKDILVLLDPLGLHQLEASEQQVSSDKVAIQIALRNLYDNAIKHSGQEYVEFTLHVREIEPDVLEFCIQDNGVGFGDPAIAFLDGGDLRMDSGFGLLGVRRLITARGGQIAAENLPDQKGCLIRFTIPGQIVQAP